MKETIKKFQTIQEFLEKHTNLFFGLLKMLKSKMSLKKNLKTKNKNKVIQENMIIKDTLGI